MWNEIVEKLFPRTLVDKEKMWNVPSELVRSLVRNDFENLASTVINWRLSRPLFVANDDKEKRLLARLDIRMTFSEAGELEGVFREESARNGNGIQIPLAYSPEVHKGVKKELADVLIFLLNALEQSGRGVEPVLNRLVSTNESYVKTNKDIWSMVRDLSPESVIHQLAFIADRSFENVDEWQLISDGRTLDYLTMLTEVIVRYALVMGWDIKSLILEAIDTNTDHYPEELTDPMWSPAQTKAEVFKLCRLMRHTVVDGETSLKRYHKHMDDYLTGKKPEEVTFDEGYKLIRLWIKKELQLIVKNSNDANHSGAANELLGSLDFSKVRYKSFLGHRFTTKVDDEKDSFSLEISK